MKKKDILIAIIATAFMILGSIEEPIPTEVEEPAEDIIHWKQEEVIEAENVTVELLNIEPVSEPTLESLGQFKLTAYCPCEKCCGKTDGITATGTQATQGRTIAVDPDVIPYGTVVVINGHEYVAEDCGGAINGNDIDVFFESHDEAWNFGVQYAEVFIKGGVENGMD
jgi:3D (Asp-Asp-Asp) domain-containing protein